jgi:uncharacterized membrane protein
MNKEKDTQTRSERGSPHDGGSEKKTSGETISNENVQTKKNIEAILKLENEAVLTRSIAEQVADSVTKSAGSPGFIVFHLFWFTGWILVNTGSIPGVRPFDPFPFNFLTLVVSLEAIFLTLLVLMTQKRMTKEADKRAHIDLQVNMLAEQEGTMILKMVQRIGQHLGLEKEMDEAVHELARKTDVHQIAETLEKESENQEKGS